MLDYVSFLFDCARLSDFLLPMGPGAHRPMGHGPYAQVFQGTPESKDNLDSGAALADRGHGSA